MLKQNSKRALAWMLAFALTLALLPVLELPTAKASTLTDALDFTTGGSRNDFGYIWDADTKVLVLEDIDLQVTAPAGVNYAIKVPAGTEIKLEGTNTVINSLSYTDLSEGYAITSPGNVIISGNGTLNATGGNAMKSAGFISVVYSARSKFRATLKLPRQAEVCLAE